MHTIDDIGNGWELEYKRADDKDGRFNGKEHDSRLGGCSDIKYTKRENGLVAEIRLEEKFHNSYIEVEADVFKKKEFGEERTEKDLYLFREKEFKGATSKQEACKYAQNLIEIIDKEHFNK